MDKTVCCILLSFFSYPLNFAAMLLRLKFKKKIYFTALLITIGFISTLHAQVPSHIEVVNNLPADSRFDDVKLSLQKHFNRFEREQERNKNGYKQWKRWEWFAERHLDPDGRVSAWTRHTEEGIMQANSLALAPSGVDIQSVNGFWSSVGPGSISNGENFLGRTESVAFHPTDPNTLYVGTGTGGLWRTNNLGANWTSLTDNLPSLSVASVVLQQSNPNIIYILTGDGDGGGGLQWAYYVKERSSGVFRSIDGGNTWEATGLNWNRSDADRYGYKLIQSPTNANLLLAATSDGLWRTTNAGTTWTRVITGNVTDVVFRPGNANNVAAITYESSLLRTSANGGETFTNRSIPSSSIGTTRSMLAVTPAAAGNVYIMMGNKADSTIRGYYRFQWSDNTFSLITNTPNIFSGNNVGDGDGGFPWWAIAVAVSPTNSNIHLAGGVIGRRSTNGGVDWTAAHPSQMHVDLHGYTYNPLDGSVYALHDGGISRSTNNGVAWTNIGTNLRVTQYYRISTTPGNVQAVLGGTQDNGHHYRTTNTSAFKWTLTCCDGMDNAIDPTNDQIIYMCTQDGGLNRSTDGGDNWSYISPIITGTTREESSWVAPIALHTTTRTTLFYAGNSGIWRSTNSGLSGWGNIGADGRGAMAQGTSNTARFYACGNNTTLRRSDNINATTPTWTIISGNTGWPTAANLTGTQITAIDVNPANSNDVWITFSGYQGTTKVYRSTNAGDSWTNLTGALPNLPVHSIKVRNMGSGNWEAYIGTDIGVFMRTNTFGWTYFSNGLPRVIVTDVEINDTYIYAGTYGRGIWRSNLYSACPTNVNYVSTYNSERIFQASGTITAATTIVGTVGANVWMKAGNYVQLNPGFEAQSGSIFTASIGPCGAALLPQNMEPITRQPEN